MNDKDKQFTFEQEDAQNLNSSTSIDDKSKVQYILDESGELIEIPKDNCRPVDYPIKHKLTNAFEVFVRVKGTENYWISNYGRCVNNANRKDKNTFYEHRQGDVHLTVFEVEKSVVSYPQQKLKTRKKVDRTREREEVLLDLSLSDKECDEIIEEFQNTHPRRAYELKRTKYKYETSPCELVAKHFLVKSDSGNRLWHKDGNKNNNWYKNLLYVDQQQYRALQAGKIKWQDLNIKQEYIEYENKSSAAAYSVYNGIRARCRGENNDKNYHACYNDTVMCEEWLNDSKAFVKWYLEHYYQVDNESMAVDKDLFGNGSHMYSPDTCCILPQGLNTLLSNCKKHYTEGMTPENSLPYGVRYNAKINKYYGQLSLSGIGETVNLSYYDTPEEAFEEYKTMKQANVYLTAAKYKDKLPEYIYKQLLTVKVQPY